MRLSSLGTMISESIDLSVNAWEKRGYWIKADRFRLKWSWTEQLGDQMRQAVIEEDWGRVAEISVKIAHRVKDVNVSQRHRFGKPWVGAWKKLQTERK